jgi:hypothetical protein
MERHQPEIGDKFWMNGIGEVEVIDRIQFPNDLRKRVVVVDRRGALHIPSPFYREYRSILETDF